MKWFEKVAAERTPDFIIGGKDNPYMLRWWIIPRNRFFNIYLHRFLRSDDDRALHDHPWPNFSYLLDGTYTEHSIAAGGVNYAQVLVANDFKFRSAKVAHRIELHDGPCWSLFITGPVVREWGFHCPKEWRHWKIFTSKSDKGEIGLGCD